MEEQSHKDEMRAALRGDFERLRRRQGGDGEPIAAVAPTAAVRLEEPSDTPETSSGSWLERLLGRG